MHTKTLTLADRAGMLAILRKAQATISAPDRWTTRTYGRDKDGVGVGILALKDAACFCALGAVYAALEPSEELSTPREDSLLSAIILRLDDAAHALGHANIVCANDLGGRDVALAAMGIAIANLEQEAM